jgi:hypothetical protein
VRPIAPLLAVLVLCVASPASAFEPPPPPARPAALLEVTPSLGLGKPTGDGSSQFNASVGFGVGAAIRPMPQLSLGGQFNLDTLSLDAGQLESDMSIYMIRVLLTPALHLGSGPIDFAVGPTFGFFYMHASTSVMGVDWHSGVRGYQLGLAATFFYAVNPAFAIGPYLSWSRLWATRVCQSMGSTEVCDGSPENSGTPGFLSAGVAARF